MNLKQRINLPRRTRHSLCRALCAGVVLSAAPCMLHAQITTSSPTLTPGTPMGGAERSSHEPPDPLQEIMETKNKLQRNDERQRRLVSDTDRLLVLANQLKAEIAVTGGETMTPVMLHQMDEIEKLARSVKEKMRN